MSVPRGALNYSKFTFFFLIQRAVIEIHWSQNQFTHFFTLYFPTASSRMVYIPQTLTNFIDPLTDFLEHDTG